MSHDSNPLDNVRAAQEEEYFFKKNQALIAQLRQRLEQENNAQAIADKTGIHDPHLMAWLSQLGFTPETVPVLHLVPLLMVAWADGTIQDGERTLLERAAADAGVAAGTPGHALFQDLLTNRPDQAFYEAALTYMRVLLAAMPEADATRARGDLKSLASQVAMTSGGLFGWFNKVNDDEQNALALLSAQLGGRNAASSVLKRV